METQEMQKRRKIAVLALTAVIVVALSLVLTCSAMDIPVMQPKLENATVYPPGPSGKWDQTFTYAVNCIFSDKVSITLEVYNLSLHDWTARGDRTYTGTGEWQSLTWEDVNICSGKCEGTSSYRFKYNGSILLTESGPTIAPPTPSLPPTVQMFKNAKVKPAYGRYNDSFTYSVFAQLNQTTNITLEVFDISSYEWNETGENQSYTETGEWQLLSWADVTNVSAVDSAGVASYRFFFFDASERRESEVFYGPELGLYPTPTPTPTVIYSGGGGGGGGGLTWRKLLGDEKLMGELAEKLREFNISGDGGGVAINPPELINATVTPENGSWHESYNYSVVVVHPNRADMWLTLDVYCPSKGVTRIVSNYTINYYNETYLFSWDNVSGNDSNELKRALRDNFTIDWVEGANISKSNGSMTIHITKDEQSAELILDEEKEKATLEISDDQTYELKVKTENGKLNIYYETNRALVEWRDVNVFSKEDAEANESPRFYIYYTDRYNNDFINKSGPKLNHPPHLSDHRLSRDNGTVGDIFVYNVNVTDRDGDNVTVTLHIVDSEGKGWDINKTEVNGTEAKNGTTVSWEYKFKEKAAGKTFGYYFSAADRIDEAEKVGGKGPSIKLGLRGWVQALLGWLSLSIIVALAIVAIVSYIVIKRRHGSIRAWLRYIIVKMEIEEKIV